MMGLGAWEAVQSSPYGTVIASFDKAVYLRFPAGLAVVTAPGVAPGPLHVAAPPKGAPGDVFVVPSAWTDQPTIWRGPLPDRASLGPDVLESLAQIAGSSALLAEPIVDRWRRATAGGGLAEASRVLGGLGPGLTPSGDDALAGMFLADHLYRGHSEDQLVAWASRVDTHEIARAFLIWAARGQSIEPVHRLLAGDSTATAELQAFGHSSGADLALGLHFGLLHAR